LVSVWRRAFQIDADRTGNLPPPPGIFPNTAAPIAHIAQGRRVLSMYRWGMPSPAFALGGQAGRFRCHRRAQHWRRWLGPEHRCLVPLFAFSEFGIEQARPWIGDFWRTGAMPGAIPAGPPPA
jgi:putative SOS response-associated peptidase YedK